MKLDEQVKWCFKQNRGIQVIKPNIGISKNNLAASKNALDATQLMKQSGHLQWAVITSYYARYDALYALLMKCGIKCEIHDCTIALLKYLFVDQNLLPASLHDELISAKELRIKSQYYPGEELDLSKSKVFISLAPQFVLKIEELIENITDEQITDIRTMLDAIIKK